mmetsp:Transcript_64999/g.155240  ORF Transcript_64999/g.155240 Transcript_64999/m.155240 type:complete len:107 (-) Transcript_64999:125-445(-)
MARAAPADLLLGIARLSEEVASVGPQLTTFWFAEKGLNPEGRSAGEAGLSGGLAAAARVAAPEDGPAAVGTAASPADGPPDSAWLVAPLDSASCAAAAAAALGCRA